MSAAKQYVSCCAAVLAICLLFVNCCTSKELMQAKDDVQDGEMKGFLDALAQISAGPGMQSLQSTHAHVQLLSGQLSGSHMLFTRFQSEQQLHTFLHSPPCVALQEQDARLPAQPVHSYVLSIGPPEANRSRAADAGGVLGVSNM